MKKFNLDKLVRVNVFDFMVSSSYEYRNARPKKYFWEVDKKEGIYSTYNISDEYLGNNLEDIPELQNHTLRDGVLYENPEVILRFVDGSRVRKYFPTHEEALEFGNSLTNDRKWLLV